MTPTRGFVSLGLGLLLVALGFAVVVGTGWWATRNVPSTLNQAPSETASTTQVHNKDATTTSTNLDTHIQPVDVCSGTIKSSSTRSTADQADDTIGYSVHVMYVLPSDGMDHQYDTDGAIARSVSSWEYWLCGQTGGAGLKLDTHDGQLDVTFIRLAASDNTIKSGADSGYHGPPNPYVRDDIEARLRQLGLIGPSKLYAVYYGGSNSFSCGGGAWPPTLPGQVAVLYKVNGSDCVTQGLGASSTIPGFADISMLHEIMHTLGFVPTTAPHHTRAGHTSDTPTDLMYAGDHGWAAPNVVLDYNHDDYYKANISNSLDLSNSIFFMSGGIQLPPKWGQSSNYLLK